MYDLMELTSMVLLFKVTLTQAQINFVGKGGGRYPLFRLNADITQ